MADGGQSSYGAKSIGTTAVLITAARNARDAVLVQNLHASNDLYVGPDSSVTSSNGIKIAAGESISVPSRGDVYGIGSAASTDARFWEVF